jgi:hypothetical protein
MSSKNVMLQTALSALLGVSLLAGTATPAHADNDDRCRRDVHKAEERLEKAVHRYGEHSRQAETRRHQLQEVRERCHMRGDDHDRDRDHR